jgi:flagellar assembly factor FliW
MKCLCEDESEAPTLADSSDVRLPMGLLGFEQIKDYLLLANPEEAPFGWLQVKDNPSLAFIIIDPFLVAPDYKPQLPEQDVAFLGLEQPQDAAVFNIVTVHGPNCATVNLKGPIVINRHSHVGKQVVIANASAYSVRHPLPMAKTAAA